MSNDTARAVFAFDAEANGLWGQIWAVGAVVLDAEGVEVARYFGRLDDVVVDDPWTLQHVVPVLHDTPETHGNLHAMLTDFAAFYQRWRTGIHSARSRPDLVVHLGYVVEAHLLREMRRLDLIGVADAPLPLIDLAGNLRQVGADPTSVDSYLESIGMTTGAAHDPVQDALNTAHAYRHVMGWT